MIITLIGMPGAGKSAVGRKLADKLHYSFIDIDREIEKRERKPLSKVLEVEGDAGFLKIEEREVLGLEGADRYVISPGGSIIYSEKAMEKLRSISKVVFLSVSLETIKSRIGNEPRGIVGESKGIDAIYSERKKLYRKYADIVINAEKKNVDDTVSGIIWRIRNS